MRKHNNQRDQSHQWSKAGEISLEVLVAVILVVAAVISLGALFLDATPFY